MNIPIVKDSLDSLRYTDLFSSLLSSRIIMIYGEINISTSHITIAKLLYLDSEPDKAIYIYINSIGGSVIDTLAIYDAMQNIRSEIITVCMGEACSAASIIFTAGNKRLLSEHSRILVHQPIGGMQGQASDLKIYVSEMKIIEQQIVDIYHKHTKICKHSLRQMMDRDKVIRGTEAIEIGFADQIITSICDNKTKEGQT